MKESEKSLRLFFALMAILSIVSGDLWFALAGTPDLSKASLFDFITIVEILGYLYFAFTLPKYLNPKRVVYVKGWLVVAFLFSAILTITESPYAMSYVGLFIGAAFTWYLFMSVGKLSH